MMSVRPCRFCVAAYQLDAQDCGFTHATDADELAPLALAMARLFQQKDPSDEQVGWFMESAEAVIDDFEPRPDKWRLRKLPLAKYSEFVARFRINGVTYVIEDGEGHIPPVRLATYREWQREAAE